MKDDINILYILSKFVNLSILFKVLKEYWFEYIYFFIIYN